MKNSEDRVGNVSHKINDIDRLYPHDQYIIDMMKWRCIIFICLLATCSTITAYAAKPHRALKIQVTGISGKMKENVDLTLNNFRNGMHYPLSHGSVLRFYARAPKAIEEAMAPFGYFHPRIRPQLTKVRTGWQAIFSITPGPTMQVKSVQVKILGEGQHDRAFIKLLKDLPIKPGKVLHTTKFEDTKTALFNLASEHGYFKAKMQKSQLVINLIHNEAKVIIIFNTGPRFHFGKTTFTKNFFKRTFLKKFLTYKKGAFYNAKELEKTQEDLVASNYFTQVSIKPVVEKTQGLSVPIDVQLLPRKAKKYSLGLGYGTDTGVRASAGVTLRHINQSGHRFKSFARGSEENSSLTADYQIPGFNPAKDHFTIGTGISNLQQTTGNGNNFKFLFSYVRQSGYWKNSLSLTYLNEKYNIRNFPRTRTYLVFPTLQMSYLHPDLKLQPSNGISASLKLNGATKNLFSQTNFFQATLAIKTLYTIKKTHTRLLFRTDLGRTVISNLIRLPLSMQLFAGGARSIRGYQYNSIGPGRNLAVVSGEIQQRVYRKWYLAAFCDAGTVGNKLQHFNIGVGPGIVWLTTVGALELTIANAITSPNKPWMIQFTMGSAL